MFPEHGFGPPPFFKFVFFGIFALIVFRILASLVGRATDHAENSAAPLLSSQATIRAKRTEVRGKHDSTRTRYFITFEQSDGTRREFPVTGEQFGQWVEGDTGTLHYQGTWFQGFERGRPTPPVPEEPSASATTACVYCATPMRPETVECPNCGSNRRN
jgi:hypothetical protein